MKYKDSMNSSVVHDSDNDEELINQYDESTVSKVMQDGSARRAKKAKKSRRFR
jgi:hypothetical protein